MTTPNPTALTLHQQSKMLEIAFDDGHTFNLPFEFLRVYSPSAEVRGHGKGQEVLQTGKRSIGMINLEPVGNSPCNRPFQTGTIVGSIHGLICTAWV